MSIDSCLADFVFTATILAPLADFIGTASKNGFLKSRNEDALHYLRGDYEYALPAPEWVQEVFRKAEQDEIQSIKDCKSVNIAYNRLLEIRGALGKRWAAKHAPRISPPKPVRAGKKRGRKPLYSNVLIQTLIGRTVKEAAAYLGKSRACIYMLMQNHRLKVDGRGGVIEKRR